VSASGPAAGSSLYRAPSLGAATDLLRHTARGGEPESESEVTVELTPERRADREVPAALYGTFVEHLYSTRRSRNALEAQVLRNPTLGS